ncbi:MAG: sodium:solute symporter [Candidatus Hydrogenedentota bacterium]
MNRFVAHLAAAAAPAGEDAILRTGTNSDVAVMVLYFAAVVGFGLYFSKYAKTTKDFFFGGQRFAWWLIAFSCIATMVGSYSFIKYSRVGFEYGLSSSQTYLNDWYWVPILLLVWLPIIYFQRIQSVPEYFERRFGTSARMAATVFLLIYLIGYVGVNLFTLGKALSPVLGLHPFTGAALSCVLVTLYVFAGGQTSVIMTDLAQGIILLIVGLAVFLAGVAHLGGFIDFWNLMPESHRYIFSQFNKPPEFSFIGIYVQDGLANSGAFILMNQGMMMRFLSLRSVHDARRMVFLWVLILAPLAAVTVSGGGWIAKALVANGELTTSPDDAFVKAAEFVCSPGIFGLVLAALLAALMSTADTLINAVSAVFVNDVYRPYVVKGRTDKHYLMIARLAALTTALIGLALVPLFMLQESIYSAHGMFTAAVTPPIVVAILLGVLWKRYNAPAVLATLVGGGILVGLSSFPPFDDWFLAPLSFGMGPDSYKFTRALFGIVASGALGVVVAFATRPQPLEAIRGLVTGTQLDAMRAFKGAEINRTPGRATYLAVYADHALEGDAAIFPQAAIDAMAAQHGDLVYVCDRRWWFGGLRSVHLRVAGPSPDGNAYISADAMDSAHFVPGQRTYAEKEF